MNEALRQEIVQRAQSGLSVRGIARELGISRGAVTRALAWVQAQRAGQAAPAPVPRPSIIDSYEPILQELLERYPNLTAERALQELRGRGFGGGYTVVHRRLRLLRPRPARPPVARFETGPGLQAQMDYGVYDIDFTREGRRRVYLFSYVLGYSRRQYLRFVEAMDVPTTLREHVHAFHHLGGAGPRLPVRQLQSGRAAARRRWRLLQSEVPGLRDALRLPPAGLPGTPAPNQGQSRTAASSMSKPACSTAAPSTLWSISTR